MAQIQVTYASDGISIANSQVIYLHADHLNTPRLASSQSQQLLWNWNSDAFGVGLPNQDVDGDGVQTNIPLRFPGQLYDAHAAPYLLSLIEYSKSTPPSFHAAYGFSEQRGVAAETECNTVIELNRVPYCSSALRGSADDSDLHHRLCAGDQPDPACIAGLLTTVTQAFTPPAPAPAP